MSSEDLPPLREEPAPPSKSAVQPLDPGFTFGIARVQQWTLGSIIAAAVGLGVWMGTLNTKLEHIEKFVDAASDGSTGVFTRLATIQKTLDLADRSSPQRSVKDEKASAVEVRIVPLMPSPGPTQSQTPYVDTLLEYKLLTEILDKDRKGPESKVAPDAPGIEGKQRNSISSAGPQRNEERDTWLDNVKQTALADLARLKTEVSANKKMQETTRTELLGLIEEQEQRINPTKK
jgi:hypothetical protein